MKEFDDLIEIIRRLRKDCPWDRKQTHHSLRKYAVEEAYELVEAVENGDPQWIKDEVADMLTQVMLHTAIAEETGEFDFKDMLEHHIDKLKRRHPHIFADASAEDEKEVLKNWVNIKKKEKNDYSVMDSIPVLPALLLSAKIQKRASTMGFDWENISGVYDKIYEEIEELKQAETMEHAEEELGDLLFAVSHLANHLGIDPEIALKQAVNKFISRFRDVENAINKSEHQLSIVEMEEIWQTAKRKD